MNEPYESWNRYDEYQSKLHWKQVAQTLATWTLYLLFLIATILTLSVTYCIASWIIP